MNKTLQTAIVSALLMMGQGIALPETAKAQETATQTYQIPAGDLDSTLRQYAAQNKLQLVYPAELVEGKRSAGLSGTYTQDEALRRLLQGSGLQPQPINARTIGLKRAPAAAPAAPAKPTSRAEPAARDEEVTNMPAIMVTGAKTLNMDIERTEDDPQPYVVFDRAQIERSGVSSLEQFLQQRLTMNTAAINSGDRGSSPATSQINLRGLSAAQTLILIDGHRLSSPAFSYLGAGTFSQGDVSGIPLAAIERIEVLPTTASGIYGGNATGGVVNIIMRRDYTGAEVKLAYGNTFSTDTATRSLDLMLGHNFNGGNTNLIVTASYSDANNLSLGDRRFVERGREAVWANNPAWFLGPSGFPPLGATPNISSSNGSNLMLDDGTPLNASFTSVPRGYRGPDSDDGAALMGNAGMYNWELADSAQADARGGSAREQALYTQPTVKSGALVVRHQFNKNLEMFVDVSSSKSLNRFPTGGATAIYQIPGASPNNPFINDIRITAPLSGSDSHVTSSIKHDRAVTGLVARLSNEWQLGVDYTWDRTSIAFENSLMAPAFTSAIVSGAVVDILRDTREFPLDISQYAVQSSRTSPFRSMMQDASIRISGPVANLPGGAAIISASIAHREEAMADAFYFVPAFDIASYYPERSQSVTSSYIELRLPLFSDENAHPWMRELELQIAGRRDDYTSKSGEELRFFGSIPSPLPNLSRSRNEFVSVDPTIALRWKPWQGLALRTSYGTGFLPPALNQLARTVSPSLISGGIDPLRGNSAAGPYTTVSGGNPDLEPEQSESWSAGIVLTPDMFPDFRLSVDYTHIQKTENIALHPGGIQGIIDDESLYPGRVTRGPNLPDDPPSWAGPITMIDNTYLNLARAELEAWDVQLDFRNRTSRYGTFDAFLTGTWQPHYKTQATSSQAAIDNAGISYRNPLRFKANVGVIWSRESWRAGWTLSHFDSYRVSDNSVYADNNGGDAEVPSQTYHDVFVSYVLARWRAETEVQLGVKNLFNKMPPLDTFSSAFYSPFGDPRLSTWHLSLRTGF